jgi:undecaprenyl-diphosphatase
MDLVGAGKAVILGIVEGLTEFIPVSSTGHLIVAGDLLDFHHSGKMFEIVIQLGAILAVCWRYRARLWSTVARLPTDPAARSFALSLVVAFLPFAAVGFLLRHQVEELMRPIVVANALVVGGFLILAIERMSHRSQHADAQALPLRTALGIGLFQLCALVPGISRAGATIMGALIIGVERKAATEFSFFLAIPTMFAATGYSLIMHREELSADNVAILMVGFVVSFIVALAVITWLVRFVSTHDFRAFGWYRLFAGAAVLGMIWLHWVHR